MSGPKFQKYVLQEQRRLQLIAKVQHELEVQALRAAIIEQESRIRNVISECDSCCETAEKIENTELLRNIDTIKRKAENVLLSSDIKSSSISQLQNTRNRLMKTGDSLLSDVSHIKADSSKAAEALKMQLFKQFEDGFSVRFEESQKQLEKSRKGDNLPKKVQALREQMDMISNNEKLPVSIREKAKEAAEEAKAIVNEDYLRNFDSLVAEPIEKEVSAYVKDVEENRVRFDLLYARYRTLCAELGKTPEGFDPSGTAVRVLEQKNELLTHQLLEKREQEEITDTIDEVMKDMGYHVIGKGGGRKKSGTIVKKELYRFNDTSAVNVTYSSDGKIIMELGKMDTVDREPDEREKNILVENMEEFCHSFHDIEKELEKRGVVLKERIMMAPPTKDYAEIINLNDYVMEELPEAKQEYEKTTKPKAVTNE